LSSVNLHDISVSITIYNLKIAHNITCTNKHTAFAFNLLIKKICDGQNFNNIKITNIQRHIAAVLNL